MPGLACQIDNKGPLNMTFLRTSSAIALTLTLAACGGGEIVVRDGPQAVHPSPSALAQGTAATTCHRYRHYHQHYKGCHGYAHYGSAPIID